MYFTQSISPGYVKTEMTEASAIPDFGTLVTNTPALEPEDVAASVVYVLGTPPLVQITELTIRPHGERF